MYNEECLRECPDGSFIDTENWVCLKCNKECKNCFG